MAYTAEKFLLKDDLGLSPAKVRRHTPFCILQSIISQRYVRRAWQGLQPRPLVDLSSSPALWNCWQCQHVHGLSPVCKCTALAPLTLWPVYCFSLQPYTCGPYPANFVVETCYYVVPLAKGITSVFADISLEVYTMGCLRRLYTWVVHIGCAHRLCA